MKNNEFEDKKAKIESALNYRFKNPQLLKTAMVHRSYYNEHQDEVSDYNERLEFLGDAVLGFCVTHQLYDSFPNLREGELSQIRAQVVDSAACQKFAKSLEIDDCLLLGKGEKYHQDGRGRDRVLANFFEALIGAIYLDGGIEAAEETFGSLFKFQIKKEQAEPSRNWKSQLQDLAQKHLKETPVYKTLESVGPEHAKQFKVAVFIGEEQFGEGEGPSKKEAEFVAAKNGLKRLQERVEA